jgi:hypothetical protein
MDLLVPYTWGKKRFFEHKSDGEHLGLWQAKLFLLIALK